MSLQLLITAEAQADLSEAVEWLGERSPELAGRFEAEVERAFKSIRESHEMFAVVHRKTRRALLRHYPYSVFFVLHERFVLVTGVVHQARDPRTWKQRSPN